MAYSQSIMSVLMRFCLIILVIDVNGEQKPCVKWGNTFDVSLESQNVQRPCQLPDGRPICCSAISNTTYAEIRGVGSSFFDPLSQKMSRSRVSCTITKKYVSSPLEIRDLEMSKSIERRYKPEELDSRLDTLLSYVTSDEMVVNSTKWLERVKIHMNSESTPPPTADDFEFLSRFEYTRDCGDEVETWLEWIEPITITARHPFGFGKCRNTGQHFKGKPRAGRSDVDYVLLQSGKSLHNQTHTSAGKSTKRSRRPSKHYMLDAGTSTFDSSLFWFTCGYAQRKIGFDQVYAWEMTLLEPTDYWRRVPAKWKPYWHFFNVPIAADKSLPDSPIRFLQQIASPADFVAFKLDIDHPAMEMPIALSLLSEPALAELVDEFFFELHFRCEVMTSCGWGKRVPYESHGLILDRPHVLQFFIDLRAKGIRAHIWP